jgi:hypothetical protein
VKRVLRAMIPCLYKKANEARAALDYYEGRTTGNVMLAVFREEVEAGRRERHVRKIPLDIPFTILEGNEIMREHRIDRFRDAFGRFRSKVTPEDFANIRFEHFEKEKQLSELVSKYPQYSKETIRRILGRDRGHVGVKGIGRVDTTGVTVRDPRPPN